MKNAKKFLIQGLVLVILLSLIILPSCKSSATSITTEAAEETTEAAEETTEAAEETTEAAESITIGDYTLDMDSLMKTNIDWKDYEGSTITIVILSHPIQRAIQPWIPAFEDLTGIKVNFDVLGYNEMIDKELMDLSSGTGLIDGFFMHLQYLPEWAENGWIENMSVFLDDPAITDMDWYDKGDFNPTIIEFCKGIEPMQPEPWGTDDAQYAVPFSAEPAVLYYRKDLFEIVGVDVPESWDDMYDTAKKLTVDTDNDGSIDTYGFQERNLVGVGQNTYPWASLFISNGGQWFDDDWMPQFMTDAGIKTTEMFVEMASAEISPPDMANYGYSECSTSMAEGNAAMWCDGALAMSSLEDPTVSKVAGKMGYATYPEASVGVHTATWPWGIAMNANSKNKEATWLFILFATSKEMYKAGLMEVGPPRQSIVESTEFNSKFPKDWLNAFNIGLERTATISFPMIPESVELMDYLANNLSEATQGKITPKEANENVDEAWIEILKDNGYIE